MIVWSYFVWSHLSTSEFQWWIIFKLLKIYFDITLHVQYGNMFKNPTICIRFLRQKKGKIISALFFDPLYCRRRSQSDRNNVVTLINIVIATLPDIVLFLERYSCRSRSRFPRWGMPRGLLPLRTGQFRSTSSQDPTLPIAQARIHDHWQGLGIARGEPVLDRLIQKLREEDRVRTEA